VTSTAEFLLRASDEFADGGWLFTGFNLPVLAARVARRAGHDFVQVLEAGAALDRDTDELLSTTTDFFRTAPAASYRGTTTDVLNGIVPKCRRVFIDAANVDVRGRTNSSAIGPWRAPKVRLPGGGGGPEAAYGARHLVLLHGGTRVERLVAETSPVTAAPRPDAVVRLLTRWGSLTLGPQPRLDVLVDDDEAPAFVERLVQLGVDTEKYTTARERRAEELARAEAVLAEARASGYAIDRDRSPRSSDAP
jgi:glutaconate CoA-transferase subunit B